MRGRFGLSISNVNFMRNSWKTPVQHKIFRFQLFGNEIGLFFMFKKKCLIADIILFCLILIVCLTTFSICFSDIIYESYTKEKQIKDYIKNQLELVVDSPLKIKLYTSSEKRSTDRIEGYDVYLVQAKDGKMKYLVNWVQSKMPEHEFIITKFEKID